MSVDVVLQSTINKGLFRFQHNQAYGQIAGIKDKLGQIFVGLVRPLLSMSARTNKHVRNTPSLQNLGQFYFCFGQKLNRNKPPQKLVHSKYVYNVY